MMLGLLSLRENEDENENANMRICALVSPWVKVKVSFLR